MSSFPFRSARFSRALRCGLLAVAVFLPFAGNAVADDNPWGKDINAGAGPELIESVREDLVAIVRALPVDREHLISEFVAAKGAATIEAVKRFRNPELLPLFLKLAEHDDWRVRHRALTALEHFGGYEAFDLAWGMRRDTEPRLREKALITCIVLWDKALAKKAERGDPIQRLNWDVEKENDPHVAGAARALLRRARNKLKVYEVHAEHVETQDDRLQITPFITGMHEAKTKAPSFKAKVNARSGGKSATHLDAERPWTTPLIAFGEEVVQGTSLQPFANLRGNGKTYHTGLDIGASMDGAGYYAAADGIVRFVHAGSDMGTLIVVQHHLGDKRLVNAVYMHGAGKVFVKAGDRVESGQLIGSMGLSYSIENGGHYAHLHYGLYPGPFSETHNYGYRGVAAGLIDWYDPKHYLPIWAQLTQPAVPRFDYFGGHLDKAFKLLAEGRAGPALLEVERTTEDEKVRSDLRDYSRTVVKEMNDALGTVVARAERLRDLGYPSGALAFLQRASREAKGLKFGTEFGATARTWTRDSAFKELLSAEKELVQVEASFVGGPGNKEAAQKAKQEYVELLERFAETALRPRIEALITGTGVQ